jgi:hypothetical protein
VICVDVITIPRKSGDCHYQVLLDRGYDVKPQEFRVTARSSVMALDFVADYCEEYGLRTLFATKEELAPICPEDKTVDEFAKMHGLTKCGINGIYVVPHQINEL